MYICSLKISEDSSYERREKRTKKSSKKLARSKKVITFATAKTGKSET
jgi:hypothetical protein